MLRFEFLDLSFLFKIHFCLLFIMLCLCLFLPHPCLSFLALDGQAPSAKHWPSGSLDWALWVLVDNSD